MSSLDTVERFDPEENKWSKTRGSLPGYVKKKIVSKVVEAVVLVCMGTHVYTFGDKVFLQCDGGPIGMRFTAALANLVMKMWDQRWSDLLEREQVEYLMYARYVDDCRLILPLINKGWKWSGSCFEFTGCTEEEERMPDSHYTTKELAKAMCSLVDFSRFTPIILSIYLYFCISSMDYFPATNSGPYVDI